MAKANLPEFQGKPLIEIPEFISTAGFLEGDFGKAVDAEVQGKYNSFPAISVVKYNPKTQVVEGSTPFYCVAVQEVVSQAGLRVANQADLELAIKANALSLRGQYEETGLVLRSEDNPNEYLARNLMAQINARNPKAKMPAMMPLSELELVADSNSPHQLAFKLKDGAEVFYDLSVLNKDGSFSPEDIDSKTGLPNKTGSNGSRNLYTRDSGLSRLYLGGDLDLVSGSGDLAYSDGDGRVVVVSAEGTALKNVYISQLQQEAERQKSEIDAKLAKAQAILNS